MLQLRSQHWIHMTFDLWRVISALRKWKDRQVLYVTCMRSPHFPLNLSPALVLLLTHLSSRNNQSNCTAAHYLPSLGLLTALPEASVSRPAFKDTLQLSRTAVNCIVLDAHISFSCSPPERCKLFGLLMGVNCTDREVWRGKEQVLHTFLRRTLHIP